MCLLWAVHSIQHNGNLSSSAQCRKRPHLWQRPPLCSLSISADEELWEACSSPATERRLRANWPTCVCIHAQRETQCLIMCWLCDFFKSFQQSLTQRVPNCSEWIFTSTWFSMSSHFSLGGDRRSESMVNTTTSIGAPRGSVISSPSTQTTAGAWNWRCHSSNTQCYSTRSFWTAPSRRGGSGPHWQILLSCAGSKELSGATRNPELAILFIFLWFIFRIFMLYDRVRSSRRHVRERGRTCSKKPRAGIKPGSML